MDPSWLLGTEKEGDCKVLVGPSGGEVESCRLVPTAGGSAFVVEVVTPRGAQGHRSGSQGTGL